MLVLSRSQDESIVINDDIKVTIIQIRGDKVRLGTEFPKGCSVHRQEVYDAIRGNEDTANKRKTVSIPKCGTEALEKICSQIDSSPSDTGQIIAAVLEAVAEKGITAEDLDSFKRKI